MTIDKELLELLACPKCRATLKQEGDQLVCQNPACALRYPIRDGMPVMLIGEAEKLQKDR